MSLADELEFCHCDLNENLNKLLWAAERGEDVTILGCGHVRPERGQEAERYARALEAWLGPSVAHPEIVWHLQTVSLLLGDHSGRKDQLAGHLIKRLRDNGYHLYAPKDEDWQTVDSRIQHLEICCFNWEQNLLILLDEIGKGRRTYGWHGVGLFCACGDTDPNNNYPKMVKSVLDSAQAKNSALVAELRQKLAQAYPQ